MSTPTYRIRDLVYGISGTGKTTWWVTMAQAIYESTGKRTRWYLGDGGGTTIDVNGASYIDVMNYNLWDHPLETTQKICEGWWPEDFRVPNSKLFPTSEREWEGIGLVVFEGLTVMSDYIMGDRVGGLANRMSKGEALNADMSYRLKDGDLSFGGNARTHYGFTQRRMLDLIERTRALPCHVGWTAHERKVEDADYRETWIGPDVCGAALTTKIGACFGNTIHLHGVKSAVKTKDDVTKKDVEKISIQRRAYLRTHFDPEAAHFVKYFANTRLPRGVDPSVLSDWIDPDPIAYYRQLQRVRDEAAERRLELSGLTL